MDYQPGTSDMRILHCLCLAAMLTVAARAAWTHEVWLERDGEIVRAYFGEPAENLHEKAGGLLDRLSGPVAFTSDAQRPLPVARKSDHFEISAAKGTEDVRLVEESMKPSSRAGATDITKTVMLAREGRREPKSVMELELVPTAPNGDVFTLLLRGEPLPKIEIVVVGPPRWEKHLKTNEKGQVTIEMPWAGRYTAEAAYIEKKPGGIGEDAYTQRRFVSTISFVTDVGRQWKE
jgi:hypothetical protein